MWWLIEASPQLNEQWRAFAHKFKDCRLSGVILTHGHTGHYPGLLYFGKEGQNADRLPSYASSSMHSFLQANEPWSVLYRNGNITAEVLGHGVVIKLSPNLTVTPHNVRHRADFTDTLAFSIQDPSKELFFCPDIDDWDGLDIPLRDLATNKHLLLLDATFYDNIELPGRDMNTIPHPRVSDTLKILKDCAAEAMHEPNSEPKIILIHMNHSNKLWSADKVDIAALRMSGFTVGRRGMIWLI